MISNWAKISDIVRYEPKLTEFEVWANYDKVWYTDAKTIWIRPN